MDAANKEGAMAHAINEQLQQAVIYSVFVRNHTPEGTFRALIGDLPRIRALGVDCIWLMPIHPLGEKARKGSLGSPYAIRDYRAVNLAYGRWRISKLWPTPSMGRACNA